MNNFLSLLLLSFLCLSSYNSIWSQTTILCREVVGSAGGNAFVSNQNLEYTLGEPIVNTIGNGAIRLTQGFHQPEVCPLTVSAIDLNNINEFFIYPNPTDGTINLQFDVTINLPFRVQVYSSIGQPLLTLPINESVKSIMIDCQNFSPGIYFLIVKTINGKLLLQSTFVKVDR